MPSQINGRSLFAALAAFVLALAVAYALSSTGEAAPPAADPGQPAQPLDVASGVAGQTTLGEAEALPALVRRPKPHKKAESTDVSTPSTPSTSSPAPTVSQPTVTPTPSTPPPPTTTPSNPAPPIRFEDSG
jgi:hypothetical protein